MITLPPPDFNIYDVLVALGLGSHYAMYGSGDERMNALFTRLWFDTINLTVQDELVQLMDQVLTKGK